jgi:hydroxymethylpyrimidine pyrophosphatase-like HAD family hydrolase
LKELALVQPTNPRRPFLLAADVDWTLLGDGQGEAWMRAFVRRYPASLRLALVTGRRLDSVLKLVEEGRLPRPDFVCGAVGTELFACDDPDNALGKKYAAQVSRWDLQAIYALGEGEGIERQEFVEGQPRFQAGFYWDARPETLAAFRQRLAQRDECRIVVSYNKYIDVLPAPLGKGNAARFLQRELGLDPTRVVVAGDSGNDSEMFETGFKGIVPGNAQEELKVVACRPWHYHSPWPAARGVLDGLRRFGFVE